MRDDRAECTHRRRHHNCRDQNSGQPETQTSERFEAVLRPDALMQAEAIKVHRQRQIDVAQGSLIWKTLPAFLHFIGGRPLVGYYVDFDIGMLDKYILTLIGIELPNPRIEVSKLYYERKYGDAPPNTTID